MARCLVADYGNRLCKMKRLRGYARAEWDHRQRVRHAVLKELVHFFSRVINLVALPDAVIASMAAPSAPWQVLRACCCWAHAVNRSYLASYARSCKPLYRGHATRTRAMLPRLMLEMLPRQHRSRALGRRWSLIADGIPVRRR